MPWLALSQHHTHTLLPVPSDARAELLEAPLSPLKPLAATHPDTAAVPAASAETAAVAEWVLGQETCAAVADEGMFKCVAV
jgi:hypothetical protein